MSSEINEILKFVALIEEHRDVLTKSQTKNEKQKKSDAADNIILKWSLTGKTLTHGGLFKKINNLKARAKTARNTGKPLTEWQTKILEIAGADLETDESNEQPESTPTNLIVIDGVSPKSDAEQILEKYETDETKLLNVDQLQRLVLLKKVKILSLQQQRLERLGAEVVADRDIVFDYVEWEGVNQI